MYGGYMTNVLNSTIKTVLSNIDVPLNDNEKIKCEKILKDVFEKGVPIAKAIGFNEGNLEWIYEHGQQRYNLGDYEKSTAVFSFLCMLTDKNPKYWFGLAASYHMLKKYLEAADAYRHCIKLEPENPIYFYHLSDCMLQKDDTALALFYLVLAINLCKDKPEYQKLKYRAEAMAEKLCDLELKLKGEVIPKKGD